MTPLATFASDRLADPLRQPTGMSGRLYPNGEFTLGYIPPKRKTEKERRYDDDLAFQTVEVDVPRKVGNRTLYTVTETFHPDILLDSPIGLSLPTNSHKTETEPKKPRGSKGITSFGKRMIRNAAWIQQKSFGRKKLGFLTVTLPSFGDRLDLLFILAQDWSELVRQFLQEFGREIKRSGNNPIWSGCTEIQEKRLKNRGEVAPHLHIVYHAHNGDFQWFITANRIRAIWKRILENRIKFWTEEDIEVDTNASIDTKTVKKDASAYLGKYMSKGKPVVKLLTEMGMSDAIPSSWWHCCTELKRVVHSLKSEVPADVKRGIHQKIDLVERGVMTYLFPIIVNERSLGYVGKFKKSLCQDNNLLQLLESFYQ